MNGTMSAGYSSSEESDNARSASTRGRRPVCRNKSALLARESRLKKKAYVSGLETRVKTLKRDAKKLRTVLGTQANYINELHSEIRYLKAALVNAPDIGTLVKKLRGPIHSVDAFPKMLSPLVSPSRDLLRSFSPLDVDLVEKDSIFDDFQETVPEPIRPSPGKRMPSGDSFSEHNYSTFYDSDDRLPGSIGVCLHVSNNKMSLEFCSKCNENAVRNWEFAAEQ